MNIINIEHISKLFGDKLIFDDASFGLQEGDKVGIVGINGTGKSTLLRMVAGEETPDSGQIIRQNNLKMAYLPQTPEFPKDATVLSYALSGDEEDWQVQSNLVQLGITEYDAKLDTLSGEKRRLYLLSVLVSGANVLILDEPSNNVDIPTLTVLEDFLNTFVGIVITVSHDRYFLDNVVDRIFEFDGNGNLLQYEGGYTDYLEAKERRFGKLPEKAAQTAMAKTAASAAGTGKKDTGTATDAASGKEKNNDWKQNRPIRLKFTFKEQREYETIDDDIAALEEKIASIDDQMMKNATNSAKLAELMAQKEETEAALEEKTERWVYLTDLAERIEEQNQK